MAAWVCFRRLAELSAIKTEPGLPTGSAAAALADIAGIDSTILKRNLAGIEVITASDVISPLMEKRSRLGICAAKGGG